MKPSKRLITITLALVLIGCALLLCVQHTRAASGLTVDWFVIGGGGQAVSAGDFALNGTVGQPIVGEVSQNDTQVCAGFWCGLTAWFAELRVHLPLVFR